jgi:hypothetical protein
MARISEHITPEQLTVVPANEAAATAAIWTSGHAGGNVVDVCSRGSTGVTSAPSCMSPADVQGGPTRVVNTRGYVAAAVLNRAVKARDEAGLPLHHHTLERATEAHAAVENGAVGKVLIDVRP